jgi:hypothetical protein
MARCDLCGEPIDPTDRYALPAVEGYERKAQGLNRRSGSDIAYRRRIPGRWAHNYCVDRAASGVAPLQESLL